MRPAIDPAEPDFLDRFIERARQALDFYAEAALVIRDKLSRLLPLRLNEAQRIVQAELTKQLRETGRIRAVVLKARQEGVSTLVAARFFRAIHLWAGIVAMVVADSLERAGVLYDIYARYYENLPPEIKPERKAVERRRYLGFTHDSSLSVRPSSDTEAGRAMTIHRLHASELAYWGPGARDTWISLLQAVPHDSGEVVVESTAKGAGGLFHELWEMAERGESGWIAVFLPWWIHEEYEVDPPAEVVQRIADDPDDFEKQALGDGIPYRGENRRLSLRKLAWRRAVVVEKFGGNPETLGRDAVRAFQQEYPATAEEAFLVSGACFFDEDRLRQMTLSTEEPLVRGRLVVDLEPERKVRVDQNPRGYLSIWERPHPDRHYVVGGDTAEGRLVAARRRSDTADSEHGDRDYSDASVVRLGYKDERGVDHPPKEVAVLHGRLVPEVFAEQVRLLGEYYACGPARHKALVGIERSHSSGQTVLQLLREHYRYVPLHWARQINRREKTVGRRVGWITDSTSRMPMLDDLAAAVRNDRFEVPSRDTVREMVTFVVWDNGKPMAEEGCHDDRVIGLGIAFQMTKEHRHAGDSPIPTWEPEDTATGY